MNETIIAVGNGGYNLAADLIAPDYSRMPG